MTHTEARELANKFGSRMCDENGDTHGEELYCFSLDDIIALKEALAQQEQEPVIDKSAAKRIATALGWTPQRTWVGLTDEEIWKFWWSRPEVPDGEDDSMEAEFVAAVRRVLAAHGIKENT